MKMMYTKTIADAFADDKRFCSMQSTAVVLQYAWFRGRMRQARQVSLSLYELGMQHTDCSATEQTATEQIALVAIS